MKVASLLFLSALAPAALAQTFPDPPRADGVYDGAKLLSPADRQTVTQISSQFQKDTGAPIVVATFPALASVGAQGMGIERYSTALFHRWRIGHAQQGGNGGILLVVARDDHKVRIELGKDWKHDYDAGARQINQGTILPAFRRGDFSGGITQGVQALANLANGGGQPSDVPPPSAAASSAGDDSSPGTFLCPLVGIVLVILFAARMSGRRRRYGYGYGPQGPYGQTTYVDDPDGDAGFAAGMIAGQMMSQPPYDPGPGYDPGPSYDPGSGFDSGGGSDSGGSDSGGFDSGDSGGGGDTGSW